MNGNVVSVSETFATSKNRSFVTTTAGQVLNKTENGQTQYYSYANDKPIGSSGALSPADFDYNYTPVSAQYPAATPGSYVVSHGDTLASIALAVFGDPKLWYIIADANGLNGDGDLRVGQQLTIPNKITNLHNNDKTFKVYNPSEIIGDTAPTLPDPPPVQRKKKRWGGFWRILSIVVTIVVAIYAPQALGMVNSVGTPTLAGAMAGAAAGNVAGQVTANAVGIQDGFSFKSLAVDVLSAGIGHGIGGLNGGLAKEAFGITNQLGQQIVNGAINNALNQGVRVAVGMQERFDWRGVAAAAIAAPIATSAGAAVKANTGSDIGRRLASGIISQSVNAAVHGGGRVNFVQIAADAFGNAIGNSIAGGASRTASQQQSVLDEFAGWDSIPDRAPSPAQVEHRDNDADYRLPGRYARGDAADEQVGGGYRDNDESYSLPGRYASSDAATGVQPDRVMKVKAGDTVSQIAGTNDPRVLDKIARYNGLRSAHEIRAGSELRIPPRDVLDAMEVDSGRLTEYSQRAAQFEARKLEQARAADASYVDPFDGLRAGPTQERLQLLRQSSAGLLALGVDQAGAWPYGIPLNVAAGSIQASPPNFFTDTFVGRVLGDMLGRPLAVLSPNNVNPLTGYIENFAGDKKVDVFMGVVPIGGPAKSGGLLIRSVADDVLDASKAAVREGSFSVLNWHGYPAGRPRPTAPLTLIYSEEYAASVAAKRAANDAIHRADPTLAGKHIHEIQPIKFNGSPTDPANKIALDPVEHYRLNTWWRDLQRYIEGVNR